MWKYKKKLPRDIFMKFPCTNPFENSSKNRTSIYLLRFSPESPKYGRDQIHISIGIHLCENIKRICPGIFSRNSRVLNPFENSSKTRISLYLLRFSPDCPKYGRDQIHISLGTHLCENIKRNIPMKFSWNSRVLTPLRIRQKIELRYICSDSVPIALNMVVTKFIYP